MSSTSAETRDKVRAMVREILATVPPEPSPETSASREPEHFVVNSIRDRMERAYDRDESAKQLITEDDLRGLDEGSRVRISASAKLTPLAADIVAERNIELIRKESRDAGLVVRSVAIGADHGGYEMKEKIKTFLTDLGLQVRDFGTNSTDAVDYPDFAHAVGKAVGSGHVDIGVIIDGAGIGSAIAANKVPGVKAAACYSETLARNSREHNGANVLTLGSGQNSFEDVKKIFMAFATTRLSEERHQRRVGMIDSIDRQYRK